MNKYGYFKYSDFAKGAKENASYSINKELQEGSALTQLSVGVIPYDFASIEQDEYITSQPKLLYSMEHKLGLLTADVSDENGNFSQPIVLTVNFDKKYSMSGITINSRNVIKSIRIKAYKDNTVVANELFYEALNGNFYPINIEKANRIVFTISKIDEPKHFFGIYSIEYGKLRLFDDTMVINPQITNNFSVIGDTLEYDTLDLTVIDPEKEDFLFQKKQPIDYIVDETVKSTFYVDSGVEIENNSVQILAYDGIANLEGTFYGGLYDNYPFENLISDILEGTGIEFEIENPLKVILNGYLPITTRRSALQQVLFGSNMRCYKGEKFIFKPLEHFDEHLNEVILDETNILKNPQKTKNKQVKSVSITQHYYTKTKKEIELYHWYVPQGDNVRITFSQPARDVKAYEVIGYDTDGEELIPEEETEDVKFIERHPNYVIVSNKAATKIVLKGKAYVDSTLDYEKRNNEQEENAVDFEDKKFELTISSDAQEVCNTLYYIYARKNSIKFNTLVDVKVGGYYSILGEKLNVTKKQQNLNGVYEVEAK